MNHKPLIIACIILMLLSMFFTAITLIELINREMPSDGWVDNYLRIENDNYTVYKLCPNGKAAEEISADGNRMITLPCNQ